MPYDDHLVDRIREYLAEFPNLEIEEKKMFRGLTFMVNGKMCISVSGDRMMCRFDPDLHEEVAEKRGFESMVMKGRCYQGYCYVSPEGFEASNDFIYWVDLCLSFNDRAKSSKKKKRSS
ncbi:MAG: TfoX/Sxy family protein [Saprospiraceae bacterium]|nr:TfoX/Sxy family protein [Saprospiraceae bacterium]